MRVSRLISMRLLPLSAALLLLLPSLSRPLPAQTAQNNFKDTSMVRAPKGVRVAIYDFEDLECPACAHAFPIVHEAAQHYGIPIIRHDFPLQMHIWSRDAAIIARYIQDKISPDAAEEYRRAVFANQQSISSKDDLETFTRQYFQGHGRMLPFIIDPTGEFAREVQADYNLGVKIGLTQTPTIFIVTQKNFVQVTDINQLYQIIDSALASAPPQASSQTSPNSKVRRSAGVAR